MIIAIEGPNCCGKTTLWRELLLNYCWPDAVRFVDVPDKDEALMPVMHQVELRHMGIWRALYDPERLYICDRHFAVTSLVYAKLYERVPLDVRWWLHQVHVFYLNVPIHVLETRWNIMGETFPKDKYQDVLNYYGVLAKVFPHWTVLDGTETVGALANYVYREALERWRR